jgi:hypothetical protein
MINTSIGGKGVAPAQALRTMKQVHSMALSLCPARP